VQQLQLIVKVCETIHKMAEYI